MPEEKYILIHILRISWKEHGDHMGLFFNSKNVISVDEYKESGIYTKEQAAKQTVQIYEKVTLTKRSS